MTAAPGSASIALPFAQLDPNTSGTGGLTVVPKRHRLSENPLSPRSDGA
jgi:hypothetical protein